MDKVTVELTKDEMDSLTICLGWGAGAASNTGDQQLRDCFLRCANAVHRNNPNWMKYAVPRGLRVNDINVRLEEGQRQMTLLALAKLSIERPGWLDALEEVALLMDNSIDGKPELFSKFRGLHLDLAAYTKAGGVLVALEESVKLQSHYAELLNAWDGGERLKFADAGEWIARLLKTGKITGAGHWP